LLWNIGLVYPLQKLYSSAFQKRWDRLMKRVTLISPGDLEQMEVLITKLENLYERSGMKSASRSAGSYPDEYSSKISSLWSGFCDTVSVKFHAMSRRIDDLIADPEDIVDYERDRERLDDALVHFRMLRAYYRRWRLETKKYRSIGDDFDFNNAIKGIAYRLARKRMVLMREYRSMKNVNDYKMKIKALDNITGGVTKLFSWYSQEFLNIDGRNMGWTKSDVGATPWMFVDFLEDDPGLAPLERFRKIPSSAELDDIRKTVGCFVDFFRKNGLVEKGEIGVLSDYAAFKDYAANFSLYSDDCDERLKAGMLDQLLMLHKVGADARSRVRLKRSFEQEFEQGFAMYFAPVDEVYQILQDGFISSDKSIHHRYSGGNYDNLVFPIDAKVRPGDIGFVFPVTRLVENNTFFEVSDGNRKHLHVYSRDPSTPLKIDVRKGVFIAPKEKVVHYRSGEKIVKESCEDYFKRFFAALSGTASWFDNKRVDNWLSRHCIFYDDRSRADLLGMMRNKDFVSVINRFTNRKYDNLALVSDPGFLKPTNRHVTHKFSILPEDRRKGTGSDMFNMTLFEWVRKEK